MSKKKTILISIGILLISGGIVAAVFLTEPEAKISGATKETAMLVDVINVERGTYRPEFITTGTVRPSQDIFLSPRVSGEVIRISESFIPGGNVKKGDMLLQIDPTDYENTLELRKSDLSQALADLSIEEGRQDVALQDLQLIGDTSLARENRELVLRKPQLNAVKARVKAARAAVKQAEVNLQRTTIRAPFDAQVINRNVHVGSQVAPGDQLSRLIGMDEYWVVVTLPVSRLRWMTFSDQSHKEEGSLVKLRDRTAWREDEFRYGYLSKNIGALEEQTRLARALVIVPDPLAYEADTLDELKLLVGSFMETHILADEIPDVIRINRDYIRQNETVWVMEEEKLNIRQVNILMQDARYAYITEGLSENDKVVTTNISTVTEGAKLRLEGETAETATENQNKDQLGSVR